jgi:hypothetical protein
VHHYHPSQTRARARAHTQGLSRAPPSCPVPLCRADMVCCVAHLTPGTGLL